MRTFFSTIVNNKWIQHLAFWVLSIYIIGSYFSISSILKPLDFVYALCFHICLVPMVYINLRLLIPRFFQRSRFFWFVISNILNIGLAILIHDLIFDVVIPNVGGGFYIVSFTDKVIIIQILLIYLFVTMLIKLSASWFRLQNLEREKVHLELEALKSQLNPHFLFNGLNSIYSLALRHDEQAPQAVLKLSHLLRFVLYEINQDRIPLSKELEMIRNYVDLQTLRFEDDSTIDIRNEGIDDPAIAPMILLPVVENAFKHGNPADGKGYIQVATACTSSSLTFRCANTIGSKDDPERKQPGGIGLHNIKKRLAYIYPEQHTFNVLRENNTFTVMITIEIS